MGLGQILFVWTFIVVLNWKSLIDIEIETTQELISLYKNKTSVLNQIYELKSKYNKLDDNKIDPKHFDTTLKMQENMYKRYGTNFTDLLGFEDPLAERKIVSKSQVNSELDYNKKKSRLESLFYERILFSEGNENITQFELVNVKPLTKASSGGFMTHGVLIGM